MKKKTLPKNVVSLTSNQLGEILAKGFEKFVRASQKQYRDDKAANLGILSDHAEGKIRVKISGQPHSKFISSDFSKKSKKITIKGHTPIRSQTGHDHDRHHHK